MIFCEISWKKYKIRDKIIKDAGEKILNFIHKGENIHGE